MAAHLYGAIWLASICLSSIAVSQAKQSAPVEDGRLPSVVAQVREQPPPPGRDLGQWLLSSGPAEWLLVLVGAWAGAIAVRSLRNMERQARAAELVALSAKADADAAVLAQRAYLDISHTERGLEIEHIYTDRGHALNLRLAVKNHGQTPATVESVVLAVVVARGPLPDTPPYQITPHEGSAFLMPKERFFITPKLPMLPHEQCEQIDRGEADLYLLGYVDYVDKFGRRHRGGYARRYDRHAPPGSNNLVFVTKLGYNYDVDLG